MTEELQQWENEGGAPVPLDFSSRETREEFARRDVQGNQYSIESQKVRG